MRTVIAAVALLASCSRPPATVADIAGTYVMTIGVDTLRLDTSGMYRRSFGYNASPPRVAVDSGRWMLTSRGRLVALRDLRRRWPSHGYDPKTGWHTPDTTVSQTASLVIDATWRGRTVLVLSPEFGWRYERLAVPR